MRDMTTGSPVKLVLSFSLPMILGSAFQQLYNTVDSIVVGRFVGANALAAVGAAFPAMFFVTSFMIGLSMGITVIVAQLFGAGETERLKTTFSTSFLTMLLLTVISTVVGYFMIDPLLRLLNTPAEIFADTATYLEIIFIGLLPMVIYNFYSAVLRGIGDSKTPLYFLIIASVVNVVLDLYFVIELHMGVAGVAYATVAAQAVSSVFCIFYTYYRISVFRVGVREMVFDQELFRLVIRYGVPTALQQCIVSMGMMAVSGLVNSFGAVTMAAYTAGNKIETFVALPAMNIGNALSTFVGQNAGAGKDERVRKGFLSVTKINALLCVAMSLVIIPFARYLIMIFIDVNEAPVVVEQGAEYLVVMFIFYFMQAVMFCLGGFFRGVGDMKTALAVSFVALSVRCISAYSMAPFVQHSSVWYSIPIGWLAGCLVGLIAYRSGKWNRYTITKGDSNPPSVEI